MPKSSVIQRTCLAATIGAVLAHAPFAAADPGTPATQQSMSAMKSMDANGDGMVSKDEYMKFYEQKFDAMDKNKDRMVSQEEWFNAQLRSDGG